MSTKTKTRRERFELVRDVEAAARGKQAAARLLGGRCVRASRDERAQATSLLMRILLAATVCMR